MHWTYTYRQLYSGRINAVSGALAGLAAPTVEAMTQLLVALLERVDPRVLRETMSIGTDDRVLEACWHFELYRVAMRLFYGIIISPSAGKVCVHGLH